MHLKLPLGLYTVVKTSSRSRNYHDFQLEQRTKNFSTYFWALENPLSILCFSCVVKWFQEQKFFLLLCIAS